MERISSGRERLLRQIRSDDQTLGSLAEPCTACCLFDECLIVSGEISDISGADETKFGSLAKDEGENCRREGEDGRMDGESERRALLKNKR